MAAHSSTMAYKTPWMEEPGRLPSMGSQRDTTERLHFTPWMELETIMLSEINQTQKYKYCMTPFMCGPSQRQIHGA